MAEKKPNPLAEVFEDGEEESEKVGENDTPSFVSETVRPTVHKDNHKVEYVTTEFWGRFRPAPYTSYTELSNRTYSLETAFKGLRTVAFAALVLGGYAAFKTFNSRTKKGDKASNEEVESPSEDY